MMNWQADAEPLTDETTGLDLLSETTGQVLTADSALAVQVAAKIKDSSGQITTQDLHLALAEALQRYSKDRPRLLVADIPGANVPDYSVPTGWVDGLSTIVSIEYPAGLIPEVILDCDAWKLYQAPSGVMIRLLDSSPQSTETVRVMFTTGYTEATVPELDSSAVVNLASSLCCRVLAQIYGQTTDPTIAADSVNYRSKGDEFSRRAKELEGLYCIHIGVKDGDTRPAASVTVRAPETRRTRLTHYR